MPSSSVWKTRTPICAQVARHQGARADHAHLGHAQGGRARGCRERATRECSTSPTMATVQVGEVLLVVADGVHVQQPLRGVRMAAVAGVDHVDMRCAQCWAIR